jgi:hypothetical protein
MKPFFNGRSENSICGRWHRFLRSETVHDGTRLIYTRRDPNGQLGQPQEFTRVKTCPGEESLSIIQEEMEPGAFEDPVVSTTPTPGDIPQWCNQCLWPFAPEEDAVIKMAKQSNPSESWWDIAKRLPGRNARQCRQRWFRYLAPKPGSEPWTPEEDRLLVDKINEVGRAWEAMRPSFNGRTAADIAHRWHHHVQFETGRDGTKLVHTGMRRNCPVPHRRKSNRLKATPGDRALSIAIDEMKPEALA